MAYIRMFITNLGKYNEGELVGKWVDLPCYDLEDQLLEIGVSDEPDEFGNMYEEWFVTDYETDIPGLDLSSEYPNIDELNELAETVQDWDEDDELLALGAYLDNGYDIDDAIRHVEDRDYIIYTDCYNMRDVAMAYVEMCGSVIDAAGKEAAENYIDWDQYAEDLWDNGGFDSKEDAQEYADEVQFTGDYDDDFIESYFNYESYGRDMGINGTFVYMNNGVYVEL